MLNGLISLPKTRAGQFFIKDGNGEVIRERLTTYGSMAIIRIVNNYVIIFWDSVVKTYGFVECSNNTRLLFRLWNEIV